MTYSKLENPVTASIRESGAVPCECGERHHPGANYYVSVIDGKRWRCLAGPFRTHSDALAMVVATSDKASELDVRAAFYAFGTVAMAQDYTEPGFLNGQLGLVPA